MDREELKQVQLAIHDLIQKEQYETALPIINEVLMVYPNDAATLNFLGYIWLMGEKPAFAYQYFRRALQEQPGNKALWTSLGRACHEMDNFEEALKYFLKSAELDPNYAMAYSNASASLVQMSRWDDAEKSEVYIECDSRLETLFQRSFPNAEVYGTRKEEDARWVDDATIDARCAIGGLPQFFRPNSKSFPGTPFLKADPEKRLMWRALFDSWGKKVIGITTKGGTFRNNSKGRTLTQEDIEPLLKLKDTVLVSLDYSVERKLDGVKYFEFATDAKNYDDTAALIAECDMVLGVNTTALHCSAALGVKTWCLVPKYHQWRYGQPSMPWYRHMRLIYQDDRTWKEVIEQLNF